MDTIRLPPDFREFFESLAAHHVRYLLVGGYAVGFHGYSRATVDLDVWVDRTPENAARVMAALDHFGLGAIDLEEDSLTEDDTIIQLGYAPLRIDLFTALAGATFDEAYASRVVHTVDGITISVIGLESLKASKRAAGRLKDRSDLEHLP